MRICTWRCSSFRSRVAIFLAGSFASLFLVLCTSLSAAESPKHQLASNLDENQGPGRHSTRSVPVNAAPLSGLINVNSATVEELADALPGIGPGKAQNIVDWRTANGAFQYLDQLLEVSGIGPKTLERITPFIQLGEYLEAVSERSSSQRETHRWVLLDIVERANKDKEQVLRELVGS